MGGCVPPSRTCVSFCVASFVSQHWWLRRCLPLLASWILVGVSISLGLCLLSVSLHGCVVFCFVSICVSLLPFGSQVWWQFLPLSAFVLLSLPFVSFSLQTSLFTFRSPFFSILLHFFEFVSRLDTSVDPPFVIHLFLVIALLCPLLLTAILSLLVSSSLSGSGEGWHGLGWGFGSYVFAAEFACLFTATCSGGFWLSSACFLTCPHACPVFVCLFTPLLMSLSRILSASYPGAVFLIVCLAVSSFGVCVAFRWPPVSHATAWYRLAKHGKHSSAPLKSTLAKQLTEARK